MKAKILILFSICIITTFPGGSVSLNANKGITGIGRSSDSAGDTAIINNIIRAGFKYLGKESHNIEKVKASIDSTELICEKNKIDVPPLLHLLRAEYNYGLGDFSMSEEEAKKALEKSESSGEYKTQAKTLLFLGRYYLRTGSFKESIDSYEEGIVLSKKHDLKGIIPGSYLGQGSVYNSIGDLKGYRQNLQLMIDAGITEKDSLSAAMGYYRLGTSFCGDSATSERRDFKMADSLLRRALEISLKRKDTSIIPSSLANIGWNFYLEKMYDSALSYYNESLKYSIPAKIYSASANSLGNIGTIYRDLEKSEEALKYYQKAIDQAKIENDLYDLQWIYMDMSNMYLKSGDTSNAYIHYVLYNKFNDAWTKSENIKGFTDARIRYEADSHNKEVALLSLRLKNNRLLNVGFTGIILLIIIIGILFFRGSKIEARRRITEMNHRISELTQVNLRQQMNPHFIFNTLNSIQYYMYQHDKLATNTYLTKFSSLMRKILDNSNHTSIPLRDELDALTLYLDLERLRFNDKFSYEINVDEEIDPLLFKVPTMLIQPYVENSISHGLMPREDKGVVKINMKLADDHIVCTIEDNGIGREAAQEKRKMRNSNHNSLGTQITTSRLDLVNSLYGTTLHTVYTDLKNSTGDPVGTRVEIQIPVMA